MYRTILSSFCFFIVNIICIHGHGRLLEPPSRSSMWRYLDDPMISPYKNCIIKNYNDNALYCGGRITQHEQNGGRCGVCGDSFSANVKDNEVGGKYAKGIVTRQYDVGQMITVIIEITAQHRGYFEFRLCPWNNTRIEITHSCLNRNLLLLKNGDSKWYLPTNPTDAVGTHELKVHLPAGVTCTQCVFQWRYRTGNNWGRENGRSGLGLGPQEEFYGCADIAIGTSEREPTLCNGNIIPAIRPTENEVTVTEESLSQPTITITTDTPRNSRRPRPNRPTNPRRPQPSRRPRPSKQPRPQKKPRKPNCKKKSNVNKFVCRNCRQYYQCVHDVAISRNCPLGTVCKRSTGRCVFPYQVPRCAGNF